jgi:predicted nucleic acid-binding protein
VAAPEAIFVTDTHPLVWFLTRDTKLSDDARSILRRAQAGETAVYVPAIVLTEFLYLVRKGRVPVDHLIELSLRFDGASGFRVAPLDMQTFSRMFYILYLSPQPKPDLEIHDLSILATALVTDAKLITKDRKLQDQTLVETVW